MTSRLMAACAASLLSLAWASLPAQAERVTPHYAAEPSDTLAEAVANFTEYNDRVRAVLERPDLTDADVEEIHQYTYTIEAALARMTGELAALQVTLERMHQAAESYNADAVRGIAEVYFETADAFGD